MKYYARPVMSLEPISQSKAGKMALIAIERPELGVKIKKTTGYTTRGIAEERVIVDLSSLDYNQLKEIGWW